MQATHNDTFSIVCQVLTPRDNHPALEELLSGSTDWPAIIELVSGQLVLPAFYQALLDKQVTHTLPDDVRDYFDVLQELATNRNREFIVELEHICHALNNEHIVPVVMKGGAALLDTIYSDPLTRIISDLDLLIPADRHADAVRIVKALGFSEHRIKETDEYHDYHPLLKKDSPVIVELHRTVTVAEYTHILPAAELLHDSLEHSLSQSRVRLPSPTHRVIHNIVHAHLQDYGYTLRKLSLRQLYECAMLCQRYPDRIDWARVAAAFVDDAERHALQHYLAQCQACFDLPCPPPLLRAEEVEQVLREQGLSPGHQIAIGLLRRLNNVLRHPGRLRRLLNPAWYASNFRNLRYARRRR